MERIRILTEEHLPQLLELSLASYAVEADLLGVADFPPLRETLQDLGEDTAELRAGMFSATRLIAAIGIEPGMPDSLISRLVVDPGWFRQGLGRTLVHWACHQFADLRVVTGVANRPAIRLYQSCGFVPQREFRKEGIPLLELKRTA